jgi:beta-lactamase regulating signal transducer with metallopeptidase domain
MMAELSLIAKATLVFAVALLATRASRRTRASVRSLILGIAFALVLALPIASAIAPAREVTIPDAYASRLLIEEPVVEPVSEQAVPRTQAARPSSPRWQLPSTRVLVWSVWLAGALVTLLPLAIGLWRLRDIRLRARVWEAGGALADALCHSVQLRRPVAVVFHDALVAPMTCGWARPMIAMPTDAARWPAADVRHALLHELEHVRRHDWPIHVLARLTCSLYWFHPAAWMAWRQLSLESERACDDAVVLRAENTAYAEQLVSLARRLSKATAVPLLSMADRRTLSTRVAAILNTTAARGRVGASAAALVLTGAAALATAIGP